MPKAELSLRERNRLEAWWAIHDAAADLALERGLVETTVNAIAQRAGVSDRTVLNYFSSKEEAILGVQPMSVPPEALTEFQASDDDMLERTVYFVAAVWRTAMAEKPNLKRRAQILEKFPELRSHLIRNGIRLEELVEPILDEEFAHGRTDGEGAVRPRNASEHSVGEHHDRAQAMFMLSRTIIHFAYMRAPERFVTRDKDFLHSAISTFREAITNPR